MSEIKKIRGGSGKGQGRKKIKGKAVRFCPLFEVEAILNKQPDKTAYIEKAVLYYHQNFKAPE